MRTFDEFLTTEAQELLFRLFTGDVFDLSEDEIKSDRDEFKMILDGLKKVASKFDEGIRTRRTLEGSDYLAGFEIRKTVEREKSAPKVKPSVSDLFKSK